nr:uncharacterized protein LOC120965225 [Aegilops tauschii subsp. strangulata]
MPEKLKNLGAAAALPRFYAAASVGQPLHQVLAASCRAVGLLLPVLTLRRGCRCRVRSSSSFSNRFRGSLQPWWLYCMWCWWIVSSCVALVLGWVDFAPPGCSSCFVAVGTSIHTILPRSSSSSPHRNPN